MGDLIGNQVTGQLFYVPINEFRKVRSLEINQIERAKIFSFLCRINVLYMIAKAGSGHIGSSFSSMDIVVWMYLNEIKTDLNINSKKRNDFFFSSKGHDVPALYSVLIGLEKLNFNLLHKLRRIDGLPGHPDIKTPNIITNTGSLGMGISKAKGIIFANRKLKKKNNVFVLTGDGELQEGQIWESLISAANHNLGELTVIVDHNKLQSDTLVSKVNSLGNLYEKFNSFGWHVEECDGNNISEFSSTLNKIKLIKNRPKIIIANTIKGKGVSFMEHTSIDSDVELYKFHSGAPSYKLYLNALNEISSKLNKTLKKYNLPNLKLISISVSESNSTKDLEKLIPSYSKILIENARRNDKIIALDADLVLDTGLIPFQKEFPDRFLECGIAEQDMVSQAGGIALMGLIPIVHSFTCFLSSRPNEQIYNNSTELTKIIYVGSLAGIIPGGPGHSHQGIRDISNLSSIPNLIIVEPSCEEELEKLFRWCLNEHKASSYIRLCSIPYEKNFNLNSKYDVVLGKGNILKKGKDTAIICYGPIIISNVVKAVKILENKFNISVTIINLPWLNFIDNEWLLNEIKYFKLIFSVDNHFISGGIGDKIAEVLATDLSVATKLYKLGIKNRPMHGTNEEVLKFHELDSESVARKIFEKYKNI